MGWSLAFQLRRQRILSTAEEQLLRSTLQEIQDWPWEQGGIDLMLPGERRGDDLRGHALVPVPPPNLGAAEPGDEQRVVDAVTLLVERLEGLVGVVEDDRELLGTDEGWLVVGGDGTHPGWVDLEEDEGSWEAALQPLPETLPPKLLEAVALLEATGDTVPETKPAQRALAKARKTVSSTANLGKLVLALEADETPGPQKMTIRELLDTVDQQTLGIVCLRKHKKLVYSCSRLLHKVEARLDDVSALAAAWLALWQRGKSRYHWGDMDQRIPDRLLGRMAREPAATAQLIADLREAREEWDDEAACRRAGEAARVLGLSGTAEAAAALVEAAVFCRVRRRGGDFQRHAGRGTMEGLSRLVLGPLTPVGGWTPPVATLRLSLQRLGEYDKDSPGHLLSALAVADPAPALRLLEERADRGTVPLKALVAAAARSPEPGASDLLRRLSCSPQDDVRDAAARALVVRDGPAALPWWLAVRRAAKPEAEAAHSPPYALHDHGLDTRVLPRRAADWEAWFAENGLEPVESIALPPEELVMERDTSRPYPSREGLLADLQAVHRSGDRQLVLALAVGAAVHAERRSSWDDPFDWADPEGLGLPLAELPPEEWVGAVLADSGLPEQRWSAVMRAAVAEDPEGGLVGWLAHRRSYGQPERPAVQERLLAEEQAWWAAHGLGGTLPTAR